MIDSLAKLRTVQTYEPSSVATSWKRIQTKLLSRYKVIPGDQRISILCHNEKTLEQRSCAANTKTLFPSILNDELLATFKHSSVADWLIILGIARQVAEKIAQCNRDLTQFKYIPKCIAIARLSKEIWNYIKALLHCAIS